MCFIEQSHFIIQHFQAFLWHQPCLQATELQITLTYNLFGRNYHNLHDFLQQLSNKKRKRKEEDITIFGRAQDCESRIINSEVITAKGVYISYQNVLH